MDIIFLFLIVTGKCHYYSSNSWTYLVDAFHQIEEVSLYSSLLTVLIINALKICQLFYLHILRRLIYAVFILLIWQNNFQISGHSVFEDAHE